MLLKHRAFNRTQASGRLFACMLDKPASLFMCGWLPCSCFTADAVLSSGVKETLRLDAICDPAPRVCILDFLEPEF